MSDDADDGDDRNAATPNLLVGAELVEISDPSRLDHLASNRALIVRRSLLATAMGSFVPLPVMDEYVAARVRAGLLMKLGQTRQVDLPPSSAEVLAEAKDGSAVRSATLTAITMVALKLAWRKVFALLAAGRGADEMAATFQFATLFDHYCARLHVGPAIDRAAANELRTIIFSTVSRTEKTRLVGAFRNGARLLGRSLLEAPRWATGRLTELAQRWISTRGNADATLNPAAELPVGDEESRWLDRASAAVEDSLSALGQDYLNGLLETFEHAWRSRPPRSPAGSAPNGQPTPPG